MPEYPFRYNRYSEPVQLSEAGDLLSLRPADRLSLGSARNWRALAGRGRAFVQQELSPVNRIPHAGAQVFRARAPGSDARAEARRQLEGLEASVYPVLTDQDSDEPWAPTGNLFVRFADDMSGAECRRTLANAKVQTKRRVFRTGRWFFASTPDEEILTSFQKAWDLYDQPGVVCSYPELIRRRAYRRAGATQWNLREINYGGRTIEAHMGAEQAWRRSEGEGAVVAIIDEGFNPGHREFHPWSKKTIAPVHLSGGVATPGRTVRGAHGAMCSGVACAAGLECAGVAPRARLMPICVSPSDLGTGSIDEALAFEWAAEQGADVISCSWGPPAGRRRPQPLPPHTQYSIDLAAEKGRKGRGCTVIFAAGNGNESVDLDGYASHDNVLAIGAHNGFNRRWVKAHGHLGSDFGSSLFCCAPGGWAARDLAVTTTGGRSSDHYHPYFEGTSCAAASVAGAAALVLAREPRLSREDVRDVLKESASQMDEEGGDYGPQTGHSPFYGFGKVNCVKAVELARTA